MHLVASRSLLLCGVLLTCVAAGTTVSAAALQPMEAPRQADEQVYGGHFRDGMSAMRAGEFDRAAEAFGAALDVRPGDLRAMVQLGRALLGSGRFAEASDVYREVDELFPEHPAGPFGLGQALLAQGDLEEAETTLAEAIERDREHYGATFYFGRAQERQGAIPEAVAAYRRAYSLNPDVLLAPAALAGLALRTGGEAVAVDILQQMAEDWPEQPDVLLALAVAQAEAGMPAARGTLERVVELDPDNRAARYNLALLEVEAGELQAAEERLRALLDRAPGDVDARLLLSSSLQRRGRIDIARRVLEEGLERTPEERALRVALAALIASWTPQSDRAVEIYRELLAEAPDDERVRRALAEVHLSRGQLQEASRHFEELLRRHPDDPELLREAGVLRGQLGREQEAREALQEVVDRRPEDTEALYELALLDLRAEQHGAAIERLERVLEAEPHRTEAHFNLGRALRAVGRTDEAREAMRRFEELQRFDDRVQELRARIRSAPGDVDAYLALARQYADADRWREAAEVLGSALRVAPSAAEARRLLKEARSRLQAGEEGRR